VKVRKVTNG
jgi:hypothetical protein